MAIRFPRIPLSLLILAVLAGPLIGFGVFRLAAGVERDRAQAHLERQVAASALAIERELAADLEVLYAVKTLFETDQPVQYERFAAMAEPIFARHPCFQALEWVPRIAHRSRRAHEQKQSGREDGLENYTITELTAAGELAVAGDREWYYPVAFVAPVEGNEQAIGFDLGSESLRREAIDRAAASEEIALSDPITLVQGTAQRNGVLALLAVFEDASEMTEAGEVHLRGFVLAVFRLDLFLQQANLGTGDATPNSILFELIDGDGGFLAVHGSPDGTRKQSLSGISAAQAIEAGGQRWHLVAFPTADYLRSLRTRQPQLLGAGAGLGWELLIGLVVLLEKRSRDRLNRKHARLVTNILKSLNDGVIVADRSGRILFANPAARAVSGTARPDVLPSEWSERHGFFVPNTDQPFPTEENPLARAIRGETIDDVEMQIRNPKVPDSIRVSVSGGPMLDPRGLVRGGVVVFRDITDRKKVEEQLRRLSSAVEQTADSVLITDHGGTIEYVNPAFEATTGYSSAEVLGRNPNILKSGVQGPEYYRELWTTILRGDPYRGTTINRKKNGDLYYAEQTITGIKDSDGTITHFVSVLKDMTERRKLQEQEIEMELAAQVQHRLFPAAPPQFPGYDFAGSVFPADATSGDYFDFIRISDDAMALVVADVTGHGVGPALVMAEVRAHLRSLFHTTDDLVSIMSTINRFLAADLDDNLFVTMLLAKLEPANGRCRYINSGHPSGYVIDQSGDITMELKSVCLPLGLFPGRWRSTEQEFSLGEGETVVLVTDGVLESEAPGGDEFGNDRFLEVLREHRRRPAREIVERVYGEVRAFADDARQVDDITVVICKRDAEAS